MKAWFLSPLLPVVLAAACQQPSSAPPGAAEMQASSQGPRRGEWWYALRRAPGPCAAEPDCGWFADALNLREPEAHFDRLDLEPADLREAARVAARESPDGDLVVHATANGATLVVREAFRAFPGTFARGGDIYARFERRSPPACTAAACEEAFAVELNVRSDVRVPDVDLSLDDLHWLDHAWVTNLVLAQGAVVAGRFVGEPGGRGIVSFEANRVYAPLPGRLDTCPAVVSRRCRPGTIRTYARDADRCLVPGDCVWPVDCSDARLACSPGYVLRSWRTAPRGCPEYACEPSFLGW